MSVRACRPEAAPLAVGSKDSAVGRGVGAADSPLSLAAAASALSGCGGCNSASGWAATRGVSRSSPSISACASSTSALASACAVARVAGADAAADRSAAAAAVHGLARQRIRVCTHGWATGTGGPLGRVQWGYRRGRNGAVWQVRTRPTQQILAKDDGECVRVHLVLRTLIAHVPQQRQHAAWHEAHRWQCGGSRRLTCSFRHSAFGASAHDTVGRQG